MSRSPADAIASRSRPDGAHESDAEIRFEHCSDFGQSVWLDDLRRRLFTSGEFSRLITEDGLARRHIESLDFRKGYRRQHRLPDCLARHRVEPRYAGPMALYEALAIRDIRDAADLLRPVYDSTGRTDGFVSLEVSPVPRLRYQGNDR